VSDGRVQWKRELSADDVRLLVKWFVETYAQGSTPIIWTPSAAEELYQKIEGWKRSVDAADPEPEVGDEVIFPDWVAVIDSADDDGIHLASGGWVSQGRLNPAGPGRWRFVGGGR
jgi:hypothetical protein